jgi:catechol 2,3-dioxygenase-like lactoylglutathione lyase family enzyme
MEINGIAHVVLTVSDFAASVPFYEKLLPYLGMKKVFKGEEFLYYLGGKTGVAISKCDERYRHETFAGSACTISAFVPGNEATSTASTVFCRSWAPRSFTRPRRGGGFRAITRCCSRTPTASAWR